jgi:hypothetical protein
MPALTPAAVLALAVSCQVGHYGAVMVDEYAVSGLIQGESSFKPEAIHYNTNGTTDHGLGQINSKNFALLGVTAESLRDPCDAIIATVDYLILVSRYHTGPAAKTIDITYAARALRNARQLQTDTSPQPVKPPILAPPGVVVLHPAPSRDPGSLSK